MSDETVVLRRVGAAALVGHAAQPGGARVMACAGGYGAVVATASEAAGLLLRNRPVRVPAGWETTVRSVVAMR